MGKYKYGRLEIFLFHIPCLLVSLVVNACGTPTDATVNKDLPQIPIAPADGGSFDDADAPFAWEQSTPEAQGIDSRGLIQAVSRVRDEAVNLHSLIMIRNGYVIFEAYVPPYDKDTLHNVKSVTKSVMSALVGIAFEEGILDSLDQTVSEYFPEYITDDLDPRKRSITLRHLLTMTSGLDLDENGPILNGIFGSNDWIETTLARPMSEDPGRRFLYSTALSHTMSGILSRASEQSLLELCNHYLFGPLGINGIQWKQDPKGYYYGGAELFMTPRDMMKFGLLFLNQGRWGGEQVVPDEWVRESTRDHMVGIEADDGYGYWWWQTPISDNGYMAAGWGGQRIIVLPSWNMVVVATFADPGGLDKLFDGFVTSSIRDNPLPPNPEALQDLKALVQDLEHPTPEPVSDLPPLAKEISRRTYLLEGVDQPSPFKDIAFDFTRPDRSTMTIGTEEGTYRLAVGLDGLYRMTPTDRFGRMPRDNRIAVRGSWTGDQSFAMDYMDIGDPNHAHLNVSFSEDRISISADIEPSGWHQMLRGIRAP
jgi:CubicO group peptidase (beta-lactamase class C family)